MCKMNKIIKSHIVLGLVLLIGNLFGQDTLLYENFQDQTLGQFQSIDNDGLELSSDFVGLSGAYSIIPVGGPSDYRAVSVSSFLNGGTADNWLISPSIEISSAQTILSWSAASLSGDAFLLESYRVLVSTTGSGLEDFTINLLEVTSEEGQTRELDLSSFIGQNIFIAFNHIGTDNYALTLDDILVSAPSAQNSVELVKICGDRYQDLAQPHLSIQVVNTGSETIQDLVVAGSINSDQGETAFNDLNIAPKDTAYITFADLYPFEADRYEIIANIISVNSTPVLDEQSQGTFYLVANPPTKKLFVEEATSTTCGWCPEGIVQKEFMQATYEAEVINVSVHTNDPMENTVYDLGLQNLSDFGGYPSSTLNRIKSIPHAEVDQYYRSDFSTVAPIELDLAYSYDSASRLLSVSLKGTAHTSLFEDSHRFSFIILEDKVTGLAPDFAQNNNFSSEASDILLESEGGINWQNLADPVPAAEMVYDDVAREIVGGFDGILGSINDANNGEIVSHELEYLLSSAFDENEIWLVAMVIDTETGEVVNAIETQMLFDSGLTDSSYKGQIDLYPNPSNEKVFISTNDYHSVVIAEVYDRLGRKVLHEQYEEIAAKGRMELTVSALEVGIYTVRLTIGEEFALKKLVVF